MRFCEAGHLTHRWEKWGPADADSKVISTWTEEPSLQFSRSVVSDSLWPHGLQHTRLPCSSPTPRACWNSCPSSWWCHPTISSSVISFSPCLQSFPESGSFPRSQFFASGGKNIGVSASASVLPMNIQDWFPLGWTGLILQYKGLSRVSSNTIVQKHQFFSPKRSLAAAKSLQLCLTLCDTIDSSPLSLGFSRQEYWNGLSFPSPMHESEKWKWSRSVMSDFSRPHGLQPTRLLCPWDFSGKSTGVDCH